MSTYVLCIHDIPNLLIILFIFLGYVVHLWVFSTVANLRIFSQRIYGKTPHYQWTPVFQTHVVEGSTFCFEPVKWSGVN